MAGINGSSAPGRLTNVQQAAADAKTTAYTKSFKKTVPTVTERKTTTLLNVESSPPTEVPNAGKNVLNSYRSYTYNFTLAALRKTDVDKPEAYRNSEVDLVILKTGGKGTAGISAFSSDADVRKSNIEVYDKFDAQIKRAAQSTLDYNTAIVSGFNANSPGRFDMYIDSVEIGSTMAFTPQSNASLATSMSFDVYEPYSINGFIEALHVAAVAAGYTSYKEASFILKMEFVGYPDFENFTAPELIDKSVRYFVIGLTGLEVDLSEKGTRYKCSAVNYSKKAFAQPNKLKSPIQVSGLTVDEILSNLMKGIEKQSIDSDKRSKDSANANKSDKYEIKFPSWDDKTGFDFSKPNKISKANVVDLLKDSAIYKFPKPEDADASKNASKADTKKTPSPEKQAKEPESFKLNPGAGAKPVVQFAEDSNVHEIISSIIRDSEYVRDILRTISKPGTPPLDDFGFIDYFLVDIDVSNLDAINEDTKLPFQKFTYVVRPYKVHYTRIPRYAQDKIDQTKLKSIAVREYNYIYTGQNIDVISFKLNFNTLFFEANPRGMGNTDASPLRNSAGPGGQQQAKSSTQDTSADTNNSMPASAKKTDPTANAVQPSAGGRGGQPNTDPYSTMAINMHESIINSKTSMLTGEIEIIGDPFYLVTGGISGYNPKPTGRGKTTDGEANHLYSELLIVINFENPVDIQSLEDGGLVKFDRNRAPFSGVYMVTQVNSTFKDGVFKQRLEIVRVSRVADSYKGPITIPGTNTVNTPDPKDVVITSTSPADAPSAAVSDETLLTVKRGINSPGLPGILSNFTAAAGGLGGSINSLLTQVSGAVSSGVGKLTAASALFGGSIPGGANQLASGIRLQTAGLTSLAQTGLGAAAIISQASTTLKSAFPVANAESALTKGFNLTDVTSNALGAVKGIGASASSLVGGIGSKITSLTNGTPKDPLAIASQFGINASQLSGLSPELQSKVLAQTAELAKKIPSNVNLGAATAQGLVLTNIPADKLANIPSTAPYTIAPIPEPDTKFLTELVKKGGVKELALAYGVTDISKISKDLLPTDTVNSLLASAPSLTNPLSGLKDKLPKLDLSIAGSKLAGASSQMAGLGNLSSSVEGNLNTLRSAVGSTIPTGDLTASVTSKFGSLSSNTSPLAKIMKSTIDKG